MPLVSVLMPAFNAESFISESIDSIRRQTLRDFELIIVDDGSSDRTGEIVERWSRVDPRIKHTRTENSGVAKTRNRLLALAESPFLAWCDADDIFEQIKLEMQWAYLSSNPQYVACGSWYTKFGASKKRILKPADDRHLKVLTFFGIPIGFPTAMMRSAPVRERQLTFDESLASSEDYDFFTKLAELGQLRNLRRFLLRYRWHGEQESQKNVLRQKAAHALIAASYIRRQLPNCEFANQDVEFLLDPRLNLSTLDRQLGTLKRFADQIRTHFPDLAGAALDMLAYRIVAYNKSQPFQVYAILNRLGVSPIRSLAVL